MDATPFASHQSMGQGVILQSRTIGDNLQLLVDFRDEERKIWMPYQYLRHIKSARYRFAIGDLSNTPQEANRFVLRTLSHAIELWNENTGALSALDIDPLPHQVNLVHHILSSGNLNWLIADDVGLGNLVGVQHENKITGCLAQAEVEIPSLGVGIEDVVFDS